MQRMFVPDADDEDDDGRAGILESEDYLDISSDSHDAISEGGTPAPAGPTETAGRKRRAVDPPARLRSGTAPALHLLGVLTRFPEHQLLLENHKLTSQLARLRTEHRDELLKCDKARLAAEARTRDLVLELDLARKDRGKLLSERADLVSSGMEAAKQHASALRAAQEATERAKVEMAEMKDRFLGAQRQQKARIQELETDLGIIKMQAERKNEEIARLQAQMQRAPIPGSTAQSLLEAELATKNQRILELEARLSRVAADEAISRQLDAKVAHLRRREVELGELQREAPLLRSALLKAQTESTLLAGAKEELDRTVASLRQRLATAEEELRALQTHAHQRAEW